MWEYAQAQQQVGAFDERFSRESDSELDERVLNECLHPPGLVVDLGCGTGRLALPLARRGFRCLGVDLSQSALREVQRHAAAEQLPIECALANLVELDALSDACADHCISMYSTLGMIRGRDNRARFLRHVRRILRPGGRFVVHVHNRWYNLFQPQSRGWLLGNLGRSLFQRGVEAGDKYFAYHGVPNMFLHVFTRSELTRDLQEAGFTIEQLLLLSVERRETLRWPWLLGRVRAGGWIAICR